MDVSKSLDNAQCAWSNGFRSRLLIMNEESYNNTDIGSFFQ